MAQFDLTDISDEQRIQFASLYVFGMPIPKALIESGFGTRSLALGLQLLKDPIVQAAVNEQRDWIKGKLADNVNSLLEQLDRDRELAYLHENPSAAVSATMSKAKLLGLLDPDASAKVPKRIVIEWGDEADTGAIPSSGEAEGSAT